VTDITIIVPLPLAIFSFLLSLHLDAFKPSVNLCLLYFI
jgi:hypothetical protein